MGRGILVVDDEPAMGRLIKMCLAAEGYEIRVTASGPEALKMAEESLPDLVILDIMMPEMTGYEVCEQLLARHRDKGLKVVFLSARGNPSDAQQGFAAGADDFIIKPFDPNQLVDKVKKMIGPGWF
jgi:CheY-like chemotaxis protein